MGAVIGLLVGTGAVLVMLSFSDRDDMKLARSRKVGALARLVERSGIPRLTSANLIGACFAAAILAGAATLIVTAVPMVALMAAAVAGYLPFLMIKRRVSARAKPCGCRGPMLLTRWCRRCEQVCRYLRHS